MAVLSAGAIAAMASASKKGKAVKFQKVQNGQVYAPKEDDVAKSRPPPPAKKPKAPSVPPKQQDATSLDPNDPDNKPAPTFTIVSSDPANWRFNVGEFHPQQRIQNPENPSEVIVPSIQIQDFHQPIKMNRKQPKSMLYAEPEPTEIKDQQFKPMLGPDGKPVYHNGQVVMVNAEGQTLASLAKAKEKAAAAAANAKGKGKATDAPGKGKKSQPKTRQVFIQSDDVRARRKEEYHPWVMEDSSGDQKWIGTMDDRNDGSLWGLLKVSGGCFEFIPIHRFYTLKPQAQIVANVRADDLEKQATSKRPDFSQVYRARMGNSSSSDVVARLEKQEKKEQKQAMRRPPKQEDDDLFMDGGEGDIDEVEYEKEASDDEEGHRPEEIAEDEDEKDSKERLKREYLGDTHGGRQTESDDEAEELDQMLMKALKNRGEMDDDDDEDDVYGSKYGVKKEEDEDTPMAIATGVQQQTPKPKAPTPTPTAKPSASGVPATSNTMDVDSPSTTSPVKASASLSAMDFTPTAPRVNSRGGSPAAPAGVGAALLAKRATSPKPTGPGRSSSPQAGRAGSPLVSNAARAASPPTAAPIAPANAATADAKKNKKRKEAPGAGDATKSPTAATPGGVAKKKKLDEGARPEPPSMKNVVEVLKASGGVTGYVSAKTLASHYQTKHNPEYKKNLIQLLKQVANITQDADGVQRIQLKPEYA